MAKTEMERALEADGKYLRAMTGEDACGHCGSFSLQRRGTEMTRTGAKQRVKELQAENERLRNLLEKALKELCRIQREKKYR